jgi:hypothetical protein
MEGKFDEDFLEIEDKQDTRNQNFQSNKKLINTQKEFKIDIENYDLSQFESEGICNNFFSEFNKCKNEKNISMSRRDLCEAAKKKLLECINRSGKFISKN